MDNAGRDARLALLASRQAGVFARAQAIMLGFSPSTIDRRLRTGVWVAVHPGVYVFAGTPNGRLTELWAAVLAAGEGSLVSHECSALLSGAERLPSDPITLTAPHGTHHRIRGVFVHQIDDVAPSHRTTVHGVPTTTPARAIVELGATASPESIGRAMDDLVRMRKTSYEAIAAVLAQLTRPGKPGIVPVARLLDERGDGYVPSQNELEDALVSSLVAGGLPVPRRQIPLPGRGPMPGLADSGYDDAQMIMEADGRRWHARVAAARRDRERDAQVVRAGWVPLRFVYEQIVGDPASMCETVEETRSTRLRQLGRAA